MVNWFEYLGKILFFRDVAPILLPYLVFASLTVDLLPPRERAAAQEGPGVARDGDLAPLASSRAAHRARDSPEGNPGNSARTPEAGIVYGFVGNTL